MKPILFLLPALLSASCESYQLEMRAQIEAFGREVNRTEFARRLIVQEAPGLVEECLDVDDELVLRVLKFVKEER